MSKVRKLIKGTLALAASALEVTHATQAVLARLGRPSKASTNVGFDIVEHLSFQGVSGVQLNKYIRGVQGRDIEQALHKAIAALENNSVVNFTSHLILEELGASIQYTASSDGLDLVQLAQKYTVCQYSKEPHQSHYYAGTFEECVNTYMIDRAISATNKGLKKALKRIRKRVMCKAAILDKKEISKLVRKEIKKSLTP